VLFTLRAIPMQILKYWFLFLVPWRYRFLIWQFARKDVVVRYRGSWLGWGWTIVTPLAMLAIYTLVFQYVFKARWPSSKESTDFDFALNLYAGLLLFNWAAELLNRAPRLILEQPNLVTKVVFPLPVLSWAALVSASFHMVISFGIWLLAATLAGYTPRWEWLGLPFALLSLAPWLLAACWVLSSFGVFLRDLSQLVGLAISGVMFLTPIFYPIQALPIWLQSVALLNPLSGPIEALRQVVILSGEMPWVTLAWLAGSGLVACASGLWLMKRLQNGFSDVL
jgi:lipopolysaccharide transport system permease protein